MRTQLQKRISLKNLALLFLGLASFTTQAQTAAALNFDPSGSYDNVHLPTAIGTNSLVGKNAITVEAWVRPTSLSGLGCVIGNYTSPGNSLQFLMRRGGATWTFFNGPGNNTTYVSAATAANTATMNVWQHVAGVYNGSVITVYINGVASATAAISTTFAASTNSILIGGNSISENFQGDIDEVRIWDYARTACQINTYMNCEITGNSAGLIANYHFNQGAPAGSNATVTALTDATSNGFNGTLNNFALTGATSNWVAPGGVVSGFTTPVSVSAATSNSLICGPPFQGTATLTATGANTYTWSNLSTGSMTAVSPSTTVTYTVVGTTSANCLYTTTITQSVSTCAGIAGVNNSSSILELYPNPSNGMFTINTSSNMYMEVVDALGKVILKETISAGQHQMNLSSFPNGMYFIKAIDNGSMKTLRMIKE